MKKLEKDLRRSFLDFSSNNEDNLIGGRIKPLTVASAIIISIVVIYFLASEDLGARDGLRWLLLVFIISLIMRPALNVKNLRLVTNGFALSFGLGLALSFFLAWFIAAVNITEFNDLLCFFSLIVLGIAINYFSHKSNIIHYEWNKDRAERFIWGFAIFALFYFAAFWVIGFNPTLDSGTENYMDYGFMQSMYRQKMMAPMDIWYSGERLNYYYLGQAAAVYMCRLAFTGPEYGYNLMLATFWAFVAAASIEIVHSTIDKITNNRTSSILGSIVALLTAAFGANGHFIVYGIIYPFLNKFSPTPVDDNYWFPDGTVYISTGNGDADNGKNEFPAYSAVLGDLHAHVINLIFVLPLIMLLIDYLFSEEDDESYAKLFIISILLGLYKGTNYWDFVIYYVITGGVVVLCDFTRRKITRRSIMGVFLKASLVSIISTVVILPFTLRFTKMASVLKLAEQHSPLHKMLVLWLFPFAVAVIFIFLIYKKENGFALKAYNRVGLCAITLCAMGLVITPELVYIEDIYGEGYTRFNIMFKLTYAAFILFALIIGIAAGMLFSRFTVSSLVRYSASIILIISIALALYSPDAVSDWMGDVFETGDRYGISTIEQLYNDDSYKAEMAAFDVIQADKKRIVNIMEAAGNSYNHESVLSVLTGGCAVAGWYVHEWLWRTDSDGIAGRSEEVMNFYQSGDERLCRTIIDKYDIDYIFVGPAEYNKYSVNTEGFMELGDRVYYDDTSGIEYMLLHITE